MNNRLITVNQNKYLEPLSSICKCYDYVWRIYPDGCVVMVDKVIYYCKNFYTCYNKFVKLK